jgi:hypothetical protein
VKEMLLLSWLIVKGDVNHICLAQTHPMNMWLMSSLALPHLGHKGSLRVPLVKRLYLTRIPLCKICQSKLVCLGGILSFQRDFQCLGSSEIELLG